MLVKMHGDLTPQRPQFINKFPDSSIALIFEIVPFMRHFPTHVHPLCLSNRKSSDTPKQDPPKPSPTFMLLIINYAPRRGGGRNGLLDCLHQKANEYMLSTSRRRKKGHFGYCCPFFFLFPLEDPFY